MAIDISLYNAGELVTMNGKEGGSDGEETLGIIHDGAFIVREGRFAWVGTTQELKEKGHKSSIIIDANGQVVLPGLIDPHTHLIFAGSREDELERKIKGESYMDILRSGGGINRTLVMTRAATEEQLLTLAYNRIKQLISSGVTTVEVKTGYCQQLEGELKLLRVISRLNRECGIDVIGTFLGLHTLPPEFRSGEEYTSYVMKVMLPNVAASEARPVFADCFCEEGLFSSALCERYLNLSSQMGFKLKIHADEFSDAHGAEVAARTGCTSADHLENSSSEGLKMMATKGVTAVLLPLTAFYSRIRQPNFKRIKESGCTFALGTDLCPNSWVESPQLVMAFACVELGMTPAEALAGFTTGAARALSLNDRGAIKEGNLADFAMYEMPSYRFLPYRIGGSYVRSVYKRGIRIYP
ncbi:MAG: imidazolonepropionase [Conexivisphaerales archaeon]